MPAIPFDFRRKAPGVQGRNTPMLGNAGVNEKLASGQAAANLLQQVGASADQANQYLKKRQKDEVEADLAELRNRIAVAQQDALTGIKDLPMEDGVDFDKEAEKRIKAARASVEGYVSAPGGFRHQQYASLARQQIESAFTQHTTPAVLALKEQRETKRNRGIFERERALGIEHYDPGAIDSAYESQVRLGYLSEGEAEARKLADHKQMQDLQNKRVVADTDALYEEAIRANDADTAVALLKDPVRRAAYAPGKAEKLIAEAPVKVAAQQADALKGQIQGMESLEELEQIQNDLNARDASGQYAQLSALKGDDRATLLRNIRTQRNYVEASQTDNAGKLMKRIEIGDIPTPSEIASSVGSGTSNISQFDADLITHAANEYAKSAYAASVDPKKLGNKETLDYFDNQIDTNYFKVMRDGDQPDPAKLEPLARQIIESDLPAPQKAYLFSGLLQARKLDYADGIVRVPGIGWMGGDSEVDVVDEQAAFIRRSFDTVTRTMEIMPATSGGSRAFGEFEREVYKLYNRDKPPTTDELKRLHDGMMQKIFAPQVSALMRGEVPDTLMYQGGVLMSAGTRN
ncbi:MAG: hypothetical protein Q7Q73_02470 [Verrucomicrobiota bacterium JB024]|nr:hypothetical protein [Verrucomicrobiota bacterium JB024]